MENSSVLKIQLIDQSEREKLLAEERQRRRLLRMKEAKEQANIFSKVNRENQKIIDLKIEPKPQYNNSHQKHIHKIYTEKDICPRLKRYYQNLEKNKEPAYLFDKFSAKFIKKTSSKLKK